ncbi:MAG TPA: hypothetical protein DD618_00205 [Acholeplasmatales bacterium]|nr:hypothetical protein [Acholeplasmatales bacterium]
MNNFWGFLAFLFVLGMIIAVHEGGHFLFAKRAGILVREFAFGMGPQILKKKKGETVYSLRAFPIGGFCAIAGEEVEDDPFKGSTHAKLNIENGIIKAFYLDVDDMTVDFPVYKIISYDLFDAEKTGNLYMIASKDGVSQNYQVDPQALVFIKKMGVQIAPYDRTIGSKTKRARAMVMFGGPLMNFLLALVVFFIAGLIQGFANLQSSEISEVEAPVGETLVSPAYAAGLRDGDVIVKMQRGTYEAAVDEWADISAFMDQYTVLGLTAPITIDYLRDGVLHTTSLVPEVYFYNIGVHGVLTADGVEIVDIATVEDKMSDNSELLIGDVIKSAEGVEYANLTEMYQIFIDYVGNNDNDELNRLTIQVDRDGTLTDVEVKPYSRKIMDTQKSNDGEIIPTVKVAMGISPTYKFNLGKSFVYSGQRTLSSFTAIIDTFDLLFNEESVTIAALSGPVGILGVTVRIVSNGFAELLNWMGLLSVNVGLLNLLPIPALDGGRLLFLGYEAVTRKKTNPKVETILITVTMFLLFGLMIYVTYNDITDLIK